jgi:hypothetical protein
MVDLTLSFSKYSSFDIDKIQDSVYVLTTLPILEADCCLAPKDSATAEAPVRGSALRRPVYLLPPTAGDGRLYAAFSLPPAGSADVGDSRHPLRHVTKRRLLTHGGLYKTRLPKVRGSEP